LAVLVFVVVVGVVAGVIAETVDAAGDFESPGLKWRQLLVREIESALDCELDRLLTRTREFGGCHGSSGGDNNDDDDDNDNQQCCIYLCPQINAGSHDRWLYKGRAEKN
jgi:hypothetical protein